MWTITITDHDNGKVTETRTWAPHKEGARTEVNARVENILNGGTVTGGILADWRNVTLYHNHSGENFTTIRTTFGRQAG